jgi:hypothetical protein
MSEEMEIEVCADCVILNVDQFSTLPSISPTTYDTLRGLKALLLKLAPRAEESKTTRVYRWYDDDMRRVGVSIVDALEVRQGQAYV